MPKDIKTPEENKADYNEKMLRRQKKVSRRKLQKSRKEKKS